MSDRGEEKVTFLRGWVCRDFIFCLLGGSSRGAGGGGGGEERRRESAFIDASGREQAMVGGLGARGGGQKGREMEGGELFRGSHLLFYEHLEVNFRGRRDSWVLEPPNLVSVDLVDAVPSRKPYDYDP